MIQRDEVQSVCRRAGITAHVLVVLGSLLGIGMIVAGSVFAGLAWILLCILLGRLLHLVAIGVHEMARSGQEKMLADTYAAKVKADPIAAADFARFKAAK
jgi:hypothetical protein